MAATLDQARAVKDQAMKTFSKLGTVVGVGITRIGEGYGIKVNLEDRPGPGVTLPDSVAGVPVRADVVGTIHKQ
jgi:hypothetical protein